MVHRCTCSHAAHQFIESNVESALSALKVRWPSRLCVVSVDECDGSGGAQHPSAGDLLYYKPEGGRQTHYLPARCYCTHRHCDGRTAPEEVGTGNEADVSAERLIFSLIDTETTCSYAPAAGLAAVTKSTQSH